ncbi:MAG: methyltransferase domain-containing protein [bacterium]|nr:methyltransferase domain-containing protein [bacterium]
MTGGPKPPDVIAEFYDRHPYPPPRRDLDDYRERWRDPDLRKAEHHLHFPGTPFRDNPDVLIAGCGTSQAAQHALRWPQGKVIGIDVSNTSLQHTADLKKRYDLDNLEIHHLPIERVAELGKRFDLVVSTGVIHHLADPDAGLQALSGVLNRNGAIHLMVYARYGRHGIRLLQEYGRLLGIDPTEAEDLGRTVAQIPPDHPLAPLLRQSADFRNPDALADALLNPREHVYSVRELLDLLGRSGLTFGRWYKQAQYLPHCGFPTKTPHRRRLLDLSVSEQYAAIELIRGSMLRHTVIAHRADTELGNDRSGLNGDAWRDVVPIQLPHTIEVIEGAPPGAAAVLINQSHTYTDLIIPITEPERAVYQRIDGARTIADTGALARTNPPDLRRLYQRLWWYDQVTFDTSVS